MTPSIPRLNRLLAAVRIVALDVGARGGFNTDLAPIAGAVEAVGFEPDKIACEQLNEQARQDSLGYRALRYAPIAIGAPGEGRALNIYRRRESSSLMEADAAFAKQFARDHHFVRDGQMQVDVATLDDAAARFNFTDAHVLHTDMQSAEREAFQSPRLIGETLLAIRTEVAFTPLYRDQPLFADIDADLRARGYTLMGLPARHAWRRDSEIEPDHWAGGAAPITEGQLIHGDALYFRRLEALRGDTPADQDRLIAYALIAFAYGHMDLCSAVLLRPRIAQRVLELCALDVSVLLRDLGRWHAKRRRRQLGSAIAKQLGAYLRLAAR